MLMADLAVNLPNDLPGEATPQAATMDDVFGTTLADGGTPGDTLAEYAYLGIGRIVQEGYPEPEVRLDYDSGTPGEYAGFDRLIAFQRGELNAKKDGITGTAAREEDWSLDMTGNWPGLVQKTSGSTELDQGRTHNPVNEITAITAATGTNWADPVHDPQRQHDHHPQARQPGRRADRNL